VRELVDNETKKAEQPPWPPPGAVKVAWCEPWPLDGGSDFIAECRLTLADAIRWQRAAMAKSAWGAGLLPALTDVDVLGDFVCVHWAWFVDAEGRRVDEGKELDHVER